VAGGELVPGFHPETELERRVFEDPELRAGLAWGKPRKGHPEGTVGAHVGDLLRSIDEWGETGRRRSDLRFIALVHDSMKYRVRAGSFAADFRGLALAINVLRYQLFKTGPLTHGAHEVVAFVKTRPELGRPNAQLGFTLLGAEPELDNIVVDPFDAVTIHQYYARPSSQGYCQIQSPDPDAAMLIDANFLDTEEDRRNSIDTIRFADRLMGQAALAGLAPRYAGPPVDFESEDSILGGLNEFGGTAFHVCGTCRMGSDPGSVVDPQLRVRGVEGLRVMDTSVMPLTPTGNTNGPAMAMAWRAAELILA